MITAAPNTPRVTGSATGNTKGNGTNDSGGANGSGKSQDCNGSVTNKNTTNMKSDASGAQASNCQ